MLIPGFSKMPTMSAAGHHQQLTPPSCLERSEMLPGNSVDKLLPLLVYIYCARFSALHMNTEPTAEVQPVVSEIGGGSVTLDWTEWNSELEVDDFFVIRFLIKYRLADNEAVVEYATSAELPSFITKHTVTGLKDRTKYEFIIEVVRLGSAGEEEVGPVSKPFLVNMPCGGKFPNILSTSSCKRRILTNLKIP